LLFSVQRKQIPKFCVVADNISTGINNVSVVYRYLCECRKRSHQKKTANAQFDTSVQLLQSQPPMRMSDCLKSTKQLPTTNSSCNMTTTRMQKTEC
jgi:hypothetical protein